MSLKAFHVFFIAVSGVLAAFCAAWALNAYRTEPSAAYLAGLIVSLAGAGALGVYAAMFQKKTRDL